MGLHEAADWLRHSNAGGEGHLAEARPAENAHREWAAQLAAPVDGGQRPSTRREHSVAIDFDHEDDASRLRVLAAEYLRGRHRRGELSATTVRQTRSTLGRLGDVHGRRPMSQFGPATIRRYQEPIAHLRPSARASARSCVTGFTRWLMAEGHVAVDPCVGVPAPRRPRAEPRAIDADGIARLLKVVPDARARAAIWLEVGLGLRRVEVHRLRVEDWSRRAKLLRVTGKGGHEREVPVIGEATAALEAYLAECPATAGPLIRSTTDPTRPLSLSALSHYMATWICLAGIKHAPKDGVSSHALRHTAASDVLEQCNDLRVVQKLLGHRNLATTAVYLRRAGIGAMRDAMEGRTYRETVNT